MPEIRAIHGLRYDLGHIGSLAEVISPPADEITPAMLGNLYQRHPANVVRVLTNRHEPGDDAGNNRNTRAARFMIDWQRQGVLRKDPDPAIYVYHQEFTQFGQTFTRRGLFAGYPVEDLTDEAAAQFAEAFPAELSDTAVPLSAVHANVSPMMGLYADPRHEVSRILDAAIANVTPLVAKDSQKTIHKLWMVTDHPTVGAIREAMANKPMYHRECDTQAYREASLYRYELQKAGPLPLNHAAHCILTVFFELTEPGIHFRTRLPLYRNAPKLTSTQLCDALQPFFEAIPFGGGMDPGPLLWQELDPGSLGFYCAEDDQWVLATLTAEGMLRMDEALPDRPEAWRYLDRTILEHLIVPELLSISEPSVTYVEDFNSLIEQLKAEEAGHYPLAALVRAPDTAQIQSLAEAGYRPEAELVVEPKPACGLVFNPLG